MKHVFLITILIQFLCSISYGEFLVDGTDKTSKHYLKDISVSMSKNDFGIHTVIVEVPKSLVKDRNKLSVTLRTTANDKESYTYIPLLVEDGDNKDSWSARTGQNVTRTWMRGRHGILFAVFKFPEIKLKEIMLEVLIGDHMKNPTYQYQLTKLNKANKSCHTTSYKAP